MRVTPVLRCAAFGAVCTFIAAFSLTPAHAQVLRGRIIDEAGGAPIADAVIRIRSADSELPAIATDSAGRFSVALPAPGTYTLRANRFGYTAVGPLTVSLRRSEVVDVVVSMGAAAVPLAPLRVTARSTATSSLADVHARIENVKRTGIGRVMTREDIEQRAPVAAATLAAALSPRISGDTGIRDGNTIMIHSGSPTVRDSVVTGICYPAVYVDGFRINQSGPANVNRYLNVDDIEAVEAYIGLGEMPMQYRDPSNCGVVLFWSRRGAPADANVLTWKRAAVGFVAIAVIVLFGR